MVSFIGTLLLALYVAQTSVLGHTVPSSGKCLELVDPFTHKYALVDCLTGTVDKRALISASGVAPTPSTASGAPALPSSTAAAANAFDFSNFNCTTVGNRTDFCAKAQAAFVNAGNILAGIFAIKQTIVVKVNIRPYCADQNGPSACYCTAPGQCDSPSGLGAAGPTLFVPLQDTDGTTRMYPQALAKQFPGVTGIKYADNDIEATFNGWQNAFAPVQFYLPGDPLPQKGAKFSDFQSTVLHEIIHGLGFLSFWQYLQVNNTNILIPQPAGSEGSQGFVDGTFDRWVQRNDNNATFSSITSSYNTAALASGATVDTAVAAMASTAQAMGQQATTALSFSTVPNAGISRYLDTSFNPWRQGSSLSHLDQSTYENTTDFLMIPNDVKDGLNLNQLVASRNGIASGDQLYNATVIDPVDLRLAVGPGLRAILQSMGWPMLTNQNDGTLPAPSAVPSSLDGLSASATLITMFNSLPTRVRAARKTALPLAD